MIERKRTAPARALGASVTGRRRGASGGRHTRARPGATFVSATCSCFATRTSSGRCSSPSCLRRWRGAGCSAAAMMVPIAILLSVVPAQAYEDTRVHLRREEHPMRSARDCLVGVREQELGAGRTAPGIYAIAKQKWMLHSHFYYFRRLDPWERGDVLDDRAVSDGLFGRGRAAADPHGRQPTIRRSGRAMPRRCCRFRPCGCATSCSCMPGPYAACGPAPSPGSSRR